MEPIVCWSLLIDGAYWLMVLAGRKLEAVDDTIFDGDYT